MSFAEFTGGPLDGVIVEMAYEHLTREVTVNGHVYGVLDVSSAKDTLIVLYGHIEAV